MRLPIRELVERETEPQAKIDLQLHPTPSRDLLVKIQPPTAPSRDLHHVPCDIVLVIDVSGSMGSRAEAPGLDASESAGLSVLDLVKHASNTIIETLGSNDRLGIVTFSTQAECVQDLTPMTPGNKVEATNKINAMRESSATNLWHGIKEGLNVFHRSNEKATSSRVPAMMVLTDGMPNYLCPTRGYIPKLRSKMPLPASIHTFGFGYELRSGLLKSISEIGGGNYAFIPDPGMLGTVFVHAVANLQSTCATNAVLELQYKKPLKLREIDCKSVAQSQLKVHEGAFESLRIPLGNLQYGQSRDILLRISGTNVDEKNNGLVHARLSYELPGLNGNKVPRRVVGWDDQDTPVAVSFLGEPSSLTQAEYDYHESRARICEFIASHFPLNDLGEHEAPTSIEERRGKQSVLMGPLPALQHQDPMNRSLVADLVGEEPSSEVGDKPQGQILMALGNNDDWLRWGRHFLPSLLSAYTRQICNSFKDPGPLQFGKESPLFLACRDRLDDVFDSVPAPRPSYQPRGVSAVSGNFNMSSYRSSAAPCFAGSAPVELASGKTIAIRKLRRGMVVKTPAGRRKVALVVRTPVVETTLCRVDDLLVTPWHPISNDARRWAFPALMVDCPVRYTGSVYSIMLQRDRNPVAHAISIGGFWGVTLGHGVVSGDSADDVRSHAFLGDFNRVAMSLLKLGASHKGGIVVTGGVERDPVTGMVNGYKPRRKSAEKPMVSVVGY